MSTGIGMIEPDGEAEGVVDDVVVGAGTPSLSWNVVSEVAPSTPSQVPWPVPVQVPPFLSGDGEHVTLSTPSSR